MKVLNSCRALSFFPLPAVSRHDAHLLLTLGFYGGLPVIRSENCRCFHLVGEHVRGFLSLVIPDEMTVGGAAWRGV